MNKYLFIFLIFETAEIVYIKIYFQVIPVVRGDGVFQRGMDYALEKLNDNGWVHVFPEARVNMDKTYIRYFLLLCTICMKE